MDFALCAFIHFSLFSINNLREFERDKFASSGLFLVAFERREIIRWLRCALGETSFMILVFLYMLQRRKYEI